MAVARVARLMTLNDKKNDLSFRSRRLRCYYMPFVVIKGASPNAIKCHKKRRYEKSYPRRRYNTRHRESR